MSLITDKFLVLYLLEHHIHSLKFNKSIFFKYLDDIKIIDIQKGDEFIYIYRISYTINKFGFGARYL